jgi:hypothetical protein
MKWIRERDALIAQTLAFVQSVTGRREEFHGPDGGAAEPGPSAEVVTFLAVERTVETEEPPAGTPPQIIETSPPRTAGDFRSEIQARVANFRKHQERFEREREAYCAATLAKVRDAIRDGQPRSPAGE